MIQVIYCVSLIGGCIFLQVSRMVPHQSLLMLGFWAIFLGSSHRWWQL